MDCVSGTVSDFKICERHLGMGLKNLAPYGVPSFVPHIDFGLRHNGRAAAGMVVDACSRLDESRGKHQFALAFVQECHFVKITSNSCQDRLRTSITTT